MGAAAKGNTSIVEYLLSHGANVNHCVFGNTALSRALVKEQQDIANILLQQGADVNVIDDINVVLKSALNRRITKGMDGGLRLCTPARLRCESLDPPWNSARQGIVSCVV